MKSRVSIREVDAVARFAPPAILRRLMISMSPVLGRYAADTPDRLPFIGLGGACGVAVDTARIKAGPISRMK